MRRFVLTLCAWFALSGVGWAQFIGNPQILTQQDTGSCASSTMCATFTIPANVNSLAFGLSGVSSDTLSFQGTVDGTNWRSILVSNMGSGSQVTATQSSGNYSVPNPGFTQVRVVLTARVSGTPTVTLSRGFGVSRLQPVAPAFPATFTAGDLLYASASTTVAGLSDVATGQVLASGGVGVAPAYTATPTLTSVTLGTSGILLGGTNLVEQRNGVNAQTFTIYNTYTAGTPDYERAVLGWSSNVFGVLVGANGTGSSRALSIGTGSTSTGALNFQTAGTNRWQIPGTGANTGHLIASGADNTYDIGASGATRPRTGYFGTSIVVPTANATSAYQVNGALAVSATAPTVAAGFGSTSPGTVTHNTGTFVVMVTVGTNAGGTTGSLTLPTAPTGWACELHDVTNTADLTRQTGYTTTTAAFSTTVAWTTGDVLVGHCGPF